MRVRVRVRVRTRAADANLKPHPKDPTPNPNPEQVRPTDLEWVLDTLCDGRKAAWSKAPLGPQAPLGP